MSVSDELYLHDTRVLEERIRALEAELAALKETFSPDFQLRFDMLVAERDALKKIALDESEECRLLKARVAELEALFCPQCGKAWEGTEACGPTHAVEGGGRESGKLNGTSEAGGIRKHPAAANPAAIIRVLRAEYEPGTRDYVRILEERTVAPAHELDKECGG